MTNDPAQPEESAESSEPSESTGSAESEEQTVIEGEVVPAAPTQQDPLPGPVPAHPADTGYTPAGVPTFDAVREKIETRYGTAIGSAELAAETPEGRSAEEQYEKRQQAAAERLEQIRESMRKPGDA